MSRNHYSRQRGSAVERGQRVDRDHGRLDASSSGGLGVAGASGIAKAKDVFKSLVPQRSLVDLDEAARSRKRAICDDRM